MRIEKTSNEAIGKRIQLLREEKGMTQAQFAAALGTSNRENIARWEAGTRELKAGMLIKISKIFDVSVDYLLGLSDVKSTEQDIKIACEVTGLSETAIEEITCFSSFTAEDDVVDRRYSEIDVEFFEKYGISRVGIMNTVVEKILPLTCDNILDIFATISNYCYMMEHTRPPLEQYLEYYDVFEGCENDEEEKRNRIDQLSKAKLTDFDKIQYRYELEQRIKHSIYDCSDNLKFCISEYIECACKNIDSFKYEGLLAQYRFTSDYVKKTYCKFNKENEEGAPNAQHHETEE